MFPIQGKFNDCIVFTDVCDQATISQLYTILSQKCLSGSKVRIMPDCHVGKACVIGTTLTVTDKVIPNLVGSDIGCGMTAVKIKNSRPIELEKLDKFIRNEVPSGGSYNKKTVTKLPELADLICPVDLDGANRGLGSLGGGNHFIELDRDPEGAYWLVVHSGSRRLGIVVNKHYQDMAYEALKAERNGGTLAELTRGKSAKEISKIRTEYNRPFEIPYELAYLSGQAMEDYRHDVMITQKYASLNRMTMINMIMKAMKWKEEEVVETIHNYLDKSSAGDWIVRKGAVSAEQGESLIIPMNMRDGILFCRGKGNSNWNYSAPHGAGRILSRAAAKESISMADYRESMKGIYSSSISSATVDESPMAYKPMESIVENVKDTVDILDIWKPVYNFKAGKED